MEKSLRALWIWIGYYGDKRGGTKNHCPAWVYEMAGEAFKAPAN